MKKEFIFISGIMCLLAYVGNAQTEEELWRKFYQDPSEENIKQFISYFPASTLMPQVAERAWGKCRADLDKKSCDAYIRYFPSGEHVAEAGEIRLRASDTEIIVDGITDVVEDVIQVFDQDENEPVSEGDQGEEPENQFGMDQGESLPAPAVSREFSSAKKTPAKSSSTKPAPVPVTKPAVIKPSVQISRIWSEHNIVINKQKGMFIHLSFKMDGLAGQACAASVYFLDATGRPIADSNGRYKSKSGKVASIRKFIPKSSSYRYNDFRMFMPYEEIHKKGNQKILFYAAIKGENGTLDKTKPRSFTLKWK